MYSPVSSSIDTSNKFLKQEIEGKQSLQQQQQQKQGEQQQNKQQQPPPPSSSQSQQPTASNSILDIHPLSRLSFPSLVGNSQELQDILRLSAEDYSGYFNPSSTNNTNAVGSERTKEGMSTNRVIVVLLVLNLRKLS